MDMPAFSVVALDCPDPLGLAGFYSRLTGREVEPLGDFPPDQVTWIELLDDGRPTLAFQKVDHYVAPTWPEGPLPQQLHLDFDGRRPRRRRGPRARGRGHEGRRSSRARPSASTSTPAGHPFCLVLRQSSE